MSVLIEAPASGATWFNLARHDDDPTDPPQPDPPADPEPAPTQDPVEDPADPEVPEESDPEPDPEGADQLGDAGKRALEAMKRERAAAKQEAAAAKRQLATLSAKVQEFEDRDKSELEKLAAKAERLADQATKATARAVTGEIKVLAVSKFADPSDAVDVLMRDPSKYVDAAGDIDADLIQADLTDLLERKPHWAFKQPDPEPVPAGQHEAERPRQPRPDPGQGARQTVPAADFRTASKEEVNAELAKFHFRPRFK
ncbi:hypothetical protein [Streptomyces sp. NPDC047990]|uniref:hypothetical protein n=1 Tax=Streptomyces sp. NPDC047990 TaxID=3365496 RepID=UPI0037215C09